MSRKYRKAPIVESVCEFRFQPDEAWDKSFPTKIHEHLHETFPKRSEEVVVQPASLENPNYVTRLSRYDERALVLIDVDRIAISQLKPYVTWKEFLPVIQQALSAYHSVVNPKEIHRIGLRYINLIEIPSQQINPANYFNFSPSLQWPTPLSVESFFVGLQIPFFEKRDILTMQLTSAVSEQPETSAVVLDLDYALGKSGEIALDDSSDWLNEAHLHVENAFENCIKDSLRELFDQEK